MLAQIYDYVMTNLIGDVQLIPPALMPYELGEVLTYIMFFGIIWFMFRMIFWAWKAWFS